MAIAAVITQSTVYGGAGGTGAAIDTRGSNLIMVALTYHTTAGANLSDNQSNVWTQLTAHISAATAGAGAVIFYCSNPTVSATHTFSTTSHFCGVNVLAVSGARTTSPFDQESGTDTTTLGTNPTHIEPGSITPSVSSCVFLTCVTNFNGSTPVIPTGYTSIGTYPTATAEGGGAAYIILTNSTAQNGSWTNMCNTCAQAVAQANFMPPATTNTGAFFTFF